jgi:hypothetical protein
VNQQRSKRADWSPLKRTLTNRGSGSTAGIALSDIRLISFHGEPPFKIIFVISDMLVIVGVLLGVIRQSDGGKLR